MYELIKIVTTLPQFDKSGYYFCPRKLKHKNGGADSRKVEAKINFLLLWQNFIVNIAGNLIQV
jgi:hypothetical protein